LASSALAIAPFALSLGLALPNDGGVSHANSQILEAGGTPTAAACDIEPRPIAQIVALIGSSTAAGPPSALLQLPSRHPADASTTAAITQVVRQMQACINAGDEYRLLSLASDAFFRDLPNSPDVVTQLEATATKTPTPAPAGSRQMLIGPWHVQQLDDGRALAAVLFASEDGSCLDLVHTKAVLFDPDAEGWRIESMDEIVWLSGADRPVPVIDVAGPPPTTLLGPQSTFCPDRGRRGDRAKRHGQMASPTPGLLE
jgi:hypothetical protein